MSAKPGSAAGKSATPFATMDVSPFLWCVDIIDREYRASRRTRAARERDDDVEISGVFDGGESRDASFRFVSRFANEKD